MRHARSELTNGGKSLVLPETGLQISLSYDLRAKRTSEAVKAVQNAMKLGKMNRLWVFRF
jgi:hypothetical protein